MVKAIMSLGPSRPPICFKDIVEVVIVLAVPTVQRTLIYGNDYITPRSGKSPEVKELSTIQQRKL